MGPSERCERTLPGAAAGRDAASASRGSHATALAAGGLLLWAASAGTSASCITNAAHPLTCTNVPNQDGFNVEVYAWPDSAGKERSVSLVVPGNYGARKGGFAQRFSYLRPDDTPVIVKGKAANDGGFGYLVAHNDLIPNLSNCPPRGDCKGSLSSRHDGIERSVVFLGRNHAIHEYRIPYGFSGYDAVQAAGFDFNRDNEAFAPPPAANPQVNYPTTATVHWVMTAGTDHPLWSVTYDLSGIPENAVIADTRAPYGNMEFGGLGTESDTIAQVAWGDTHLFKLGDCDNTNQPPVTPLTLNSCWRWSEANPFAPFSLLTLSQTNAEMGIAGTRTIARQDAGGYRDAYGEKFYLDGMNKVYYVDDGGRGDNGNPDDPRQFTYALCRPFGYNMPCASRWSFQSVNYSFIDNDTPTSDNKLAWGSSYGVLGQNGITMLAGVDGIRTANGDVNNANNIVLGWPYVSYSTYIVLAPKNHQPTVAQARQAAVVELANLTPANGTTSVAASGPAGVGEPGDRIVTYSPPGFNHIYGTWELVSGNGSAAFSVAVSAQAPDSLRNPTFVIRNYTATAPPTSVRLAGGELVADQDYFASVWTERDQLWVTLKHSFAAGSQTAVEVDAPAGGGPADSDGDGIPDQWEIDNGLNPNDPTDAGQDPDIDGLTNLEEFNAGTDPDNLDSDFDGIRDGVDTSPSLASNQCFANEGGATFGPLVVNSGGTFQCAAVVPVTVAPDFLYDQPYAGRLDIFALQTHFSPGFSLPVGVGLRVDPESAP